jgi:acyl dehydratase
LTHVEVGEELPAFSRRTSFANWNRFAAVNDEFIGVHMDDEAGRAAGNEAGAFGMGNLRLSYLMNMVRSWRGGRASIRSVEVRYLELNQKDDVLTTLGRVVAVEVVSDVVRVELDVDVRNQHGRSTAPGRVVVELPRTG